jgi:acid phosphatase (class A)
MLHRTARFGALLVAALSVSSVALAAEQPKPAKSLKFLVESDVDPRKLLPPPPADGSDEQRTELAALVDIVKTRTPARYAQALWDDEHADASIFATAIGAGFDPAKLPATVELLALVKSEQAIAGDTAKNFFKRTRPWAIERSIVACNWKPGDPENTTYPSGTATLGYSLATVLAALIPEKAQAIQARAKDFAFSREVCGAHYPSDVEASHALGVTVAVLLLHHQALQQKIEAARQELRAAHLTG